MGLLSWVLFGALAGWVASMIAGTNQRQGCLTDIIVGVVGAFIGGFVVNLVSGSQVYFGWNWRAFGVAVLGAVLLLVLTGASRRSRRRRRR